MATAAYEQDLGVTRLAGSLGAEVRGISLAKATPADADAIQSLLMTHMVLFFLLRDYHLQKLRTIHYYSAIHEMAHCSFAGLNSYPNPNPNPDRNPNRLLASSSH